MLDLSRAIDPIALGTARSLARFAVPFVVQGTLQPQVHLRGRKPAIRGPLLERLRKHLAEHPDATLEERIEALGLDCSINTMWKTLRRLGWRYKKSHRAPLSKSAPMSPKNAPTGAIVSSKSIPCDWSSSTKRG